MTDRPLILSDLYQRQTLVRDDGATFTSYSAEHPAQRAALLAATFSTDTVIRTVSVDRGATVGTAAQTLMPANAQRRGFVIQNQSTTATIYINTLATATADFHSLAIGPAGYYDSQPHHVGTGAVSIISTAAGTPVYAREF